MDIFPGPYSGATGSDFFDLAEHPLHLHNIADFDGTLSHDDEPADKVVDEILGPETDTDSDGASKKGKGLQRDIDDPKGEKQDKQIGKIEKYLLNAGSRRFFEVRIGEETSADDLKDISSKDDADDEYDDGDEEFFDRDRLVVDHQYLEIPDRLNMVH